MKNFIAIEGCMGSGKSTLAKELAKAIGAGELIEESDRHPFIQDFYADSDFFALQTELGFVLLHYHQILKEMRSGLFKRSVVSDFALERDYVFSTITLKEKNDWDLFEEVYTQLKKRLPRPDTIVLLKAPVDFLMERIAQRGREYEKGMTKEYLGSINQALEDYFLNKHDGSVVAFNAPELDASINPNYVETVISRLPLHLNKLAST